MGDAISSPQLFKLYNFKYGVNKEGKMDVKISPNEEFEGFMDRTKKAGLADGGIVELLRL